jgi:hypothetical protein
MVGTVEMSHHAMAMGASGKSEKGEGRREKGEGRREKREGELGLKTED